MSTSTSTTPQATMAVFMNKTKADDDNISEQVRLEDQHETVIYAMGGKPLYAPVDLTKPGLHILDSACANGRWIKDLIASSPAKHEYVGTDVVESLYPKPPPEGARFFDQSIKEPFPETWNGKFDLVHQRLVMAAAGPERTPSYVVQNLADLLKEGGWLQMVEVATAPLPQNPVSQNQYIDMLDTLYANLYAGTKYQKSNLWSTLPEEMEGAGLKNVQKKEVIVGYGAAVADPYVRERSLRTAVAGVPNFLSVLRKMSQNIWKSEWDDLESRLYNDLKEKGGYTRYIITWGQK
ncbi:hypothetical protein F4805DRAFT_435712 [Annulohypoxylon moriforme]|nr:hypothetical protein F4805DRAFT_435712 [Annulohypoxylon moriforme]